MNAATIEIPEDYTHRFGTTDEEVARNVKIELAIAMYREAQWSTGKAARFAGMTRLDFMELLRDRKVPLPYTVEMLEEDFAYARSRVG